MSKTKTVSKESAASNDSWASINFSIKGVSPLMMHNGRLSDPLNPYSLRIKKITEITAKKRTESQILEMREIEWEGGLYLSEKSLPCIPGELIEAMLAKAGAGSRKAQSYKAGLMSIGEWELEYDGPKGLEALRADRRFMDCRNCGVNGNRVIRSRPIFQSWALDFEVMYLPSLLDSSRVIEDLRTAGKIIGLGDYRPKYGRFVVSGAKVA